LSETIADFQRPKTKSQLAIGNRKSAMVSLKLLLKLLELQF
jgi:hypothetical protein